MSTKVYTTIVGTGSYVPKKVISNSYFNDAEFYDQNTGNKFETANSEIIRKFYEITNIEERRYAEPHQVTSDLATLAAKRGWISDVACSSDSTLDGCEEGLASECGHVANAGNADRHDSRTTHRSRRAQ